MKRLLTILCFFAASETGLLAQHLADPPYAIYSNCFRSYYKIKDSAKALFKSQSVTVYLTDSALKNPRFLRKDITEYDRKGNYAFYMNIDSNMHVTDSARYWYDNKGRYLGWKSYAPNDSTGEMEVYDDKIMKYDDKGNEVYDSLWRYDIGYDDDDEKLLKKRIKFKAWWVHKYVYSPEGDMIKDTYIRQTTTDKKYIDTNIAIKRYDKRHNEIYSSGNTGWGKV